MRALTLDFDEESIPPGAMGLALSGGGIRCATLSLGFVQALARHRRLLDFDYLSTVSGGGYFGSFLRSLFVPDDRRGVADPDKSARPRSAAPHQADPQAVARIQGWVEHVLSLDAREETVPDPFAGAGEHKVVRNPIWWLREHGRYLAPNGPTDYGYAISYLLRNWVGLLYTFAIGATLLSFLLFGADWLAWSALPALALRLPVGRAAGGAGLLLSPLAILPFLLAFLVLAAGLGYWLTTSLTTGNPWNSDARPRRRPAPVRQFWRHWAAALALAAGAAALLAAQGEWPLPPHDLRFLRFWDASWPWRLIAFGIELAIVALAISGIAAYRTAAGSSGDDFTNELRLRLTRVGAVLSQAAAAAFGVATVDTLALAVSGPVTRFVGVKGLSGVAAVTGPAVAWLIGKVPQWLGGGRLANLLGRHVWTVALVVGTLLFGAVAVLADALVQSIAWPGGPAPLGASAIAAPDWPALLPAGGAILILCVVTGSVTGFINMSSLHGIYAGRLTRAYLGASNLARLRLAAKPGGPPITENHPKDYIDISCYQDVPSAAPVHLIGVTLNETHSRARSQMIDRDRKGVPVVFAPDGILVDAGRAGERKALHRWRTLRAAGVESLSVGQLCAISGAAASSGMGARTTLGGALAFTFANIRLGYWWRVGRLLPETRAAEKSRAWRVRAWLTRPFRTYHYLMNEMLARYSRDNRRVYLSDGGHFDDSAVYELLRRNVPVIVCCDGGADPAMEFGDLENLARKARVDLGLAVVAAPAERVRARFGGDGAGLFLNGGDKDWREVARTPGGTTFALLLEVYSVRRTDDPARHFLERVPRGHIVWIKPRLIDGLPPDVAAYGQRNAPFPQQATGDQFFDEAQWESYRALGYTMAETLLLATANTIDAFRRLIPPCNGAAQPAATRSGIVTE